MMDELKPCPFCGGDGKIVTGVTSGVPRRATAYVKCVECGASAGLFYDFAADGSFVFKAIEAWNRRYEDGRKASD